MSNPIAVLLIFGSAVAGVLFIASSIYAKRAAIAECVKITERGWPDKNFTDAAECGRRHGQRLAVMDAWMTAVEKYQKANKL